MEPDAHRPWPVPDSPWVMKQTWSDILFLHYPVASEVIRSLVPHELEVDVFDGTAWISMVAFRMSGLRMRLTPPIPFVSQFPSLNVRTYVKRCGKPGVYFFSLDAHTRLGVFFGRFLFKLPYYYADISMKAGRQGTSFSSYREGHAFDVIYRPKSEETYMAARDTLDHFLLEKYCLYTERRGRLYESEINHQPWELKEVSCAIGRNTMLHKINANWLQPERVHFSKQKDVHIWPIRLNARY